MKSDQTFERLELKNFLKPLLNDKKKKEILKEFQKYISISDKENQMSIPFEEYIEKLFLKEPEIFLVCNLIETFNFGKFFLNEIIEKVFEEISLLTDEKKINIQYYINKIEKEMETNKQPILSNIEIKDINQDYIIKYFNFDKKNNFQNIKSILTLCILKNIKYYKISSDTSKIFLDFPNFIYL